MTLFGLPMETIYFYLLILFGFLTIIYLFFGDVIEGIGGASGFLNPALFLAFVIFFSVNGYIFERVTSINSFIILAISIGIAIILSTILNVFVLIPLSNAEGSLSYTEDSLIGRVGKIIIPIPEDGYGEIFIESNSGMISKPAASMDKVSIQEGTHVLVLEITNGVLYVVPYEDKLRSV
ncbi:MULTISPECIES: hypothetical protein [unclassified Virgibacillus]|uniref:hypothetical protein n=1 Tax=unclassified Virgibacillus TaxID=2620237 RepID=UPI0024DE0F4B|nr:hypothetical protein [Virgibacillus sp. LDC-1]